MVSTESKRLCCANLQMAESTEAKCKLLKEKVTGLLETTINLETTSKFKYNSYESDIGRLQTVIKDMKAKIAAHADLILPKDQMLFVKDLQATKFERLEYRLGRLEENVFDGSELSSF